MSDSKTPWFVLRCPEVGRPFKEFYDACCQEGVLDKKTKELLLLTAASVLRCSNSIEEHIKGALKAGASREEITECLLLAAAQAAAGQLAWNKELYEKYLGSSSTQVSLNIYCHRKENELCKQDVK
jgi:AhpD family alkylhydroperoxidase